MKRIIAAVGRALRSPYAAVITFVVLGVVVALVGRWNLQQVCAASEYNRDIMKLMLRHAYDRSGDEYWKALYEPVEKGPDLCQRLRLPRTNVPFPSRLPDPPEAVDIPPEPLSDELVLPFPGLARHVRSVF